MRYTICLVLALTATINGCATAPDTEVRQLAADATEGKFSLTAFEWDGALSEKETVSIVNTHGDLRVRSAVENHVAVSAQIQRFAGDDHDIEVIVEQQAGQLQVYIREFAQPAERAAPGTERGTNGQFDGRVDMAVLMPNSVQLMAKTGSGLLNVKNHKTQATLTTDSGSILATGTGPISAQADSGEIRIGFKETAWTSPAKISSRSGPIMVNVPNPAHLAIKATTRGELLTRLDGPVSRKGGTASATLGSGMGHLIIRSASGAIELRQAGVD